MTESVKMKQGFVHKICEECNDLNIHINIYLLVPVNDICIPFICKYLIQYEMPIVPIIKAYSINDLGTEILMYL